MTYPHTYTPAEHRRGLDRLRADLGLADAKAHWCIGNAFRDAADGLEAAVVASLTPAELAERVARQRAENRRNDGN